MRTTLRKLTVARLLVIFLLLPALTSAETAVQVWVQSYSRGYGNDTARAIAVDGNNNVIVTGFSWGGGTSSDYATIKYSSAGVVLWTKLYNYGGFDYANAVAVDGNNDVIVTGQSTGSDGHTLDYATIKYSSAGIPLWTNRYNELGNGNAVAKSVAVDGNNDVIVTGIVTIKYSSTGVPLWTNHYGAYFFNSARAVAVDSSNNVIVTGNSSSISSADYATIKYSSAGVPLWTNRYDGSRNGYDDAMAVAVDSSDNVIVTGLRPAAAAVTITRQSSIRATACRFGPTAITDQGTTLTLPAPW